MLIVWLFRHQLVHGINQVLVDSAKIAGQELFHLEKCTYIQSGDSAVKQEMSLSTAVHSPVQLYVNVQYIAVLTVLESVIHLNFVKNAGGVTVILDTKNFKIAVNRVFSRKLNLNQS